MSLDKFAVSSRKKISFDKQLLDTYPCHRFFQKNFHFYLVTVIEGINLPWSLRIICLRERVLQQLVLQNDTSTIRHWDPNITLTHTRQYMTLQVFLELNENCLVQWKFLLTVRAERAKSCYWEMASGTGNDNYREKVQTFKMLTSFK